MEEIIQTINNYYEKLGDNTRYWIVNGRYFVCYDCMDDMEDIHELTQSMVVAKYNNIKHFIDDTNKN